MMNEQRRRRRPQGVESVGGIGTNPTLWQAPQATPLSHVTFPNVNSGANRNYGGTGAYLDTMPHRWNAGEVTNFDFGGVLEGISKFQEEGEAADALGISRGQLRQNMRTTARNNRIAGLMSAGAPAVSTPSPSPLAPPTIGTSPATGAPTAPPPNPPATLPVNSPVSPPPIPPARATTAGMSAPPVAGTGSPVPTPPPAGSSAPSAPSSVTWDYSTPDVSTGASHPFDAAVRSAPEEPLDSPVDWRDSRDMDPLGLPGGAGDRALEEWLRGGGSGSSIVPPSNSRNQRRNRNRPDSV